MNHPDNKGRPRVSSDELRKNPESSVTMWKTPLIENEKIVELPVDQRTITRRYTDKAIEFVTANKDKPFFLYLPHSMPHIPLYVPDDVRDPDPQNAYTCVIEHIDATAGAELADHHGKIRRLELGEDEDLDRGVGGEAGSHQGDCGCC